MEATFIDASPVLSAPHTPDSRPASAAASHMFTEQDAYPADEHQQAPPFWQQDADAAAAAAAAAAQQQQHQQHPHASYLSDLYDADPIKDAGGAHPHDGPYHHPSQQVDPHAQFFRRASFPHVRGDNEDGLPPAPSFTDPHQPHHTALPPNAFVPHAYRPDHLYAEPMPMEDGQGQPPLVAHPSVLHFEDPYSSSASASPHSSIHDFEPDASNHSSPVIVPTQFYPHPAHHGAFMNPHVPLPVMHTDDAASKETQYLRRRCYNCHTTEPPSWRRSTLNPGKIVCNKCGLYERTHLRPRPQRFDELRSSTNKRNKPTKSGSGGTPGGSPKPKAGSVKKEQDGEYTLAPPQRRGSVTSISSGASDWESGYAPSSGAASPMTSTFSVPPGPPSNPGSRPASREGPIRLPTAPFQTSTSTTTASSPAMKPPYYVEGGYASRRAATVPEITGWQVIPQSHPGDLNGSGSPKRTAQKIAAA